MTGAFPLPEDDLLAAELALGLLDADERADAEARLVGDADFAASHRRWADQATTLVDADETLPPDIWSAILARLPANDDRPVASARLRRWQFATAASLALAIGLGAVALSPISPQPAQPPSRPVPASPPAATAPLVAVLAGETDDAIVAVSFESVTRRLTVAPARLALGRKVAELWVIPAGQSPRSVGVIDPASPRSLLASTTVSAVLIAGATLAISVEPIGGSPTGQPTGPVILTGKITTT